MNALFLLGFLDDITLLFNSLKFLYLFLPVTFAVFWLLKSKNQRYVWLTITGYVFYAFWNYRFCALMALSTLISFVAGLALLKYESPLSRKLCLVLPIVCDLLLLGYFKYADFGIETINGFGKALGCNFAVPALNVVLPVGISFYTFHTISYIADSYRKVIIPTRNFFEFSCYVSLFSQLVAGPIVRFREIERDLERIDGKKWFEGLDRGFSFLCIGIIEKVLIADTLALLINEPLSHYQELSTQSAWLCMLGYTYQLFFDFAGYSNMAIGLGCLFGLTIPQNFNSPYKAVNISDFWRRWHMSLSSCLRDYIYIPLGGNKKGKLEAGKNMMYTMLIGGLWHGAAWTFVFWGFYHGALLLVNKLCEKHIEPFPLPFKQTTTFLAVLIGWVFFRSTSFEMALTILNKMFWWQPGTGIPGGVGLALVLTIAAVLAHLAPNAYEIKHEWRKTSAYALSAMFALAMLVIYAGNQSPFLYFQF